MLPALAAMLLAAQALAAPKLNGFDLAGSLVPADEILPGGPPRDGIPAIDRPTFVGAGEAAFLKPGDRVLGMVRGGIAKAYPVSILNWHEIVNDHFGREAVVVSFCPLCGSGVAFSSQAGGRARHFGVSGLLYNSDVLLYDRETESLWSQLLAKAVTGPERGVRLRALPLSHTTWSAWRQQHPDTLVLSRATGFARDYERDPYDGYYSSGRLFFPVTAHSKRYHPKERVLGLTLMGKSKAYPYSELAKTSGEVADRVGGLSVRVHFDKQAQSARAFDRKGRELAGISAFWFAWYAFHPDTEIFAAK